MIVVVAASPPLCGIWCTPHCFSCVPQIAFITTLPPPIADWCATHVFCCGLRGLPFTACASEMIIHFVVCVPLWHPKFDDHRLRWLSTCVSQQFGNPEQFKNAWRVIMFNRFESEVLRNLMKGFGAQAIPMRYITTARYPKVCPASNFLNKTIVPHRCTYAWNDDR